MDTLLLFWNDFITLGCNVYIWALVCSFYLVEHLQEYGVVTGEFAGSINLCSPNAQLTFAKGKSLLLAKLSRSKSK